MDAGHDWPWNWISGAGAFHARWFPESSKDAQVQGFWFGAQKASYRTLFENLSAECQEPLQTLAREASFRPFGLAPAWSPPALARLRFKAAVFLDQMSRNLAALRRGSSQAAEEAARLKELCDAVAVPMALSVIADAGGPDAGSKLMELGSVSELCFLSLVLRHSRKPGFVAISKRLLEALSRELRRQGEEEARHGIEEELALCSRFLDETQEAAEACRVEAYLSRALALDEPQELCGLPEGPVPSLAVLDVCCQQRAYKEAKSEGPYDSLAFLDPMLDPVMLSALENHELIGILSQRLGKMDLLRNDRGIVLSLSGGVDSMVTCCLLWLLQRKLPPEQRFRWCALHLRHPNRDDSRDEECWVQWSCSKLGVRLFTYRLEIRRPHGTLRTGISRERYEEKSKELRFRMYERCLAHLGLSLNAGAALVVHHQDDADENRLAELGKGNIVHIDGMLARSSSLGVEVIRPLLQARKAQLIDFADAAGVCYMRDSTPRWSRRGWIRRLLNEKEMEDKSRFAILQAALCRAGTASSDLGHALDTSLETWKVNDVIPGVLKVPPAAPSRKSATGATAPVAAAKAGSVSEVAVVLMKLPGLLSLAADFEGRLRSLVADFQVIALPWNSAIQTHRQGSQEASVGVPVHMEADHCDEGDDMGNGAPGACPLQKITVCDEPPDAGPFLLGRAVCAALNAHAEVNRLLRGQLVARKALKHLWDCVARARREYQWGSMHKQCPCLYIRETNSLLLCDAEGLSAEFADAAWQFRFAAAAIAFARQH